MFKTTIKIFKKKNKNLKIKTIKMCVCVVLKLSYNGCLFDIK